VAAKSRTITVDMAARAASAPTPAMSPAMARAPWAVLAMVRDISWVVADCSSTALATVCCTSLSRPIRCEMALIALMAALVSAWMAAMRRPTSAVDSAVWRARFLTSLATTAKPRPASPARAASMVAFSASRLVCSAMPEMASTTVPMPCELTPSRFTAASASPARPAASPATLAASLVVEAISRTVADISSAPAAMVWVSALTRSAAVVTERARSVVASAVPSRSTIAAERATEDSRARPASARMVGGRWETVLRMAGATIGWVQRRLSQQAPVARTAAPAQAIHNGAPAARAQPSRGPRVERRTMAARCSIW